MDWSGDHIRGYWPLNIEATFPVRASREICFYPFKHLCFYSGMHLVTLRHFITIIHIQSGDLEVTNPKTGDKCVVKLIPYSYFSREHMRRVRWLYVMITWPPPPPQVIGKVLDKTGKQRYALRVTGTIILNVVRYWEEVKKIWRPDQLKLCGKLCL